MKYWAVLILLLFSLKAIASGTAIIGLDNRMLVASETRFQKPFSMVGRLSYTYTGRAGSCTASLIASNLILTNAHCVFTAGASGKGYAHSNFKFSPQYVKGGTNLEIPATWLEVGSDTPTKHVSSDFAILQLDKSIGNELGYFKMCSISDPHKINGMTVSTIGYPGDVQGGHQMTTQNNCKFTRVEGDPNNSNAAFMRHNCDTFVGASGSPLFRQTGSGYEICGLHSRGNTEGVADNDIANHNGAVAPAVLSAALKNNMGATQFDYEEISVELADAQCSINPIETNATQLAEDVTGILKFMVSSTARASFYLCNKMKQEYQMAVAYGGVTYAEPEKNIKANTKWITRGWQKLAANYCTNIEGGALKQSDMYIHIKESGGGEKSFCVKNDPEFKILHADQNCEAGASMVPFTLKVPVTQNKPQILDFELKP